MRLKQVWAVIFFGLFITVYVCSSLSAAHPIGASDLGLLREQINRCDDEIVHSLGDRVDISRQVKEAKARSPQGLGVVYVPERQQAALDRLTQQSAGGVSAKALDAIYTEIFSASIAIQKALKIGYIGPFPSVGYVVARDHFGKSLAYRSYENAAALRRGLAQGEIDYAVLDEASFKAESEKSNTFRVVNKVKAPEEANPCGFYVVQYSLAN